MARKKTLQKHSDCANCANCKHSLLFRTSTVNPIIAECRLRPNTDPTFRMYHQTFVASYHFCSSHTPQLGKQVELRTL